MLSSLVLLTHSLAEPGSMMCRRCCLIHSVQGAGASASAVKAAVHRLQQLSQAPAPFQRAASEMSDMLLPVPSDQEVRPPSSAPSCCTPLHCLHHAPANFSCQK